MIANSTHLSKRMFRSQRLVVVTILAGFVTLLIITALAGHHGGEIVRNVSNRVGLNEYSFKTSAAINNEDLDTDSDGMAEDVTEQHKEEQEEEEAVNMKATGGGKAKPVLDDKELAEELAETEKEALDAKEEAKAEAEAEAKAIAEDLEAEEDVEAAAIAKGEEPSLQIST